MIVAVVVIALAGLAVAVWSVRELRAAQDAATASQTVLLRQTAEVVSQVAQATSEAVGKAVTATLAPLTQPMQIFEPPNEPDEPPIIPYTERLDEEFVPGSVDEIEHIEAGWGDGRNS